MKLQNVQTIRTNYSKTEPVSKLNIRKMKRKEDFPNELAEIEFTLLRLNFKKERNTEKTI